RRWSLRRAHRRAARELPPRDPNVCRAPWARSPRRFGRLSRGLTSPPAPPRSGEGSLDSGPADRFASGAVATTLLTREKSSPSPLRGGGRGERLTTLFLRGLLFLGSLGASAVKTLGRVLLRLPGLLIGTGVEVALIGGAAGAAL